MQDLKSLGKGIGSLGLAVIKWVLSVNPYLSNTVAPKFCLGLKGKPAYDNTSGKTKRHRL